ncbi:MAG TPA: DUF805 domain-containing protein [Usitatibacter sp.]|nr:DUF805 domain-containing protein [Usitatibacter sp.]
MNWFMIALKKYAVFSGRARRKEFWMFVLFYFIFAVVAAVVDSMIGVPVLGMVLMLGLLVPSFAVGARRLHDIGKSGWWQLLVFLPLVGAIILIIFWVMDSNPGDNQYGPNPKA